MTEDEAKTKWCPYQNTQSVDFNPATNITSSVLLGGCCIGSACMAWRENGITGNPRDGYSRPNGDGFCGLAGRP